MKKPRHLKNPGLPPGPSPRARTSPALRLTSCSRRRLASRWRAPKRASGFPPPARSRNSVASTPAPNPAKFASSSCRAARCRRRCGAAARTARKPSMSLRPRRAPGECSPTRSIRRISPSCLSAAARSGFSPGAPTSTPGRRTGSAKRLGSTSTSPRQRLTRPRACSLRAAFTWPGLRSTGISSPTTTQASSSTRRTCARNWSPCANTACAR